MQLKISIITVLIEHSILGKLDIGPGMVLGYFSGLPTPSIRC